MLIRLIKFEFSRLVHTKKIFLIEALLAVIGVSGIVLCAVFYSQIDDTRIGVMSLFNSFTQFTFLVLAYILVQQIAQDIQDGSVILLNYLGYSQNRILLSKLIVLSIVLLPSIDFFIFVGSFYYGCNDYSFIGLTILLLDFSVLLIIACAAAISSVLKRVGTATIAMYLFYLVSNILNLFCFGLFNQADGNSISTRALQEAIGISARHPSLDKLASMGANDLALLAIVASVVWITLFVFVAFISGRNRKKASDEVS